MSRLLLLTLTVLRLFGLCSGPAAALEVEKITFQRQPGGLELSAYFAKPERAPPYPAAVFLHGCSGIGTSGSLSPTYSAWMRQLTGDGIAVLAIDSVSPRKLGITCGRGEGRTTMYSERPGDAYAGLEYLQSRTDIIAGKIGLLGWSQGGGIALLTVATKSRGRPEPAPAHDFAAAVAFYPGACSERLQSKPFTGVERGTWSAIAPLLVLQGGTDNWTRPEPCKYFIDAARDRGESVEIIIYPDAAHSFDAPNFPLRRRSGPLLIDGTYPLQGTDEFARQDAFKRVSAFLKQHLLP